MINTIGDTAAQQVARNDYNSVINARHTIAEKEEEVRKNRPIEEGDGSQKSDMEEDKKKKSTENIIVGKQVVFKKYNDKGELIFSVPPEKVIKVS